MRFDFPEGGAVTKVEYLLLKQNFTEKISALDEMIANLEKRVVVLSASRE